jgi:hypothetical protein
MTHSPAPWKYESLRGWSGDRIMDANGKDIVYEMATPNGDGSANGHLIAAAPDLLAALKVFVDRFEDCEDASDGEGESWQSSELSDMIKVAKAAISKAEPNEMT